MAVWTTAYVNSLPDSSFLVIDSGGKKDSDGKTTPRDLRHLPVKDAQGNVDLDHVRNALARIPQSDVSAAAKADATSKAEALLKASKRSEDMAESPPRDDLVRSSAPFELVRSETSDMPVLHGVGAVFNEWTEIRSSMEGHFFERFAPGSFDKTITERGDKIRCLFHHGLDPSIGVKPLGPITKLYSDDSAVRYEVQLLDTDYNRSLIPGLEAGLYGSSFRFGVVRKKDERFPMRSDRNPTRILERTVGEAYMKELGPTPLPQYSGTSAGLRSLTDDFVLGRFPSEQLLRRALRLDAEDLDCLAQMMQLGTAYIAEQDEPGDEVNIPKMEAILTSLSELVPYEVAEDEGDEPEDEDDGGRSADTAPSRDAVLTGTSLWSAAQEPSTTPLWSPDRDEEVAPSWRL